jgi:hypothetical protein
VAYETRPRPGYPGTPIENAVAVMDAMEKYAYYFN